MSADPLAVVWMALDAHDCKPHGSPYDFRACCPVHDGGNADSLHVQIGADDSAALYCFARRCESDAIMGALGLDWRDRFPDGHRHGRPAKKFAADNGRPAISKESGAVVVPPPTEPMKVARLLVAQRFTDAGTEALTLRHWRGAWWAWRTTHWAEIEQRAVRAIVYAFTEDATYLEDTKAKRWAPSRYKVANVLEALAAATHLPERVVSPCWLDGRNTGTVVSCANGLLEIATRRLSPHTPAYFGQVAVPFAYDPNATAAPTWTRFLADLWPDDADSPAALAEWFGYILSGSTAMQKILLVVGPTRGGKGAIARVLAAMVGRENVAGPTLSSLSGDFGLAPLIGRPLAVVSDARLNGRDSSVVVERLLSISGEDRLTVNIKYREQWSGTLPSRFMLLSNELPQLGDASAAIAGRFVTLLLSRSWLGHEDRDLEHALHAELPAILNSSLDGLARLEANGEFTKTPAADDAYRALVDLASPVTAFIRDRCKVGPEQEISVDDLYRAWKSWADENGHGRKTKQTFGRDLRAAVPRLQVAQQGPHDDRIRVYQGIAVAKPKPPEPTQGTLA